MPGIDYADELIQRAPGFLDVNNPLEEDKVRLFDDFVTEDSVYLMNSEDVQQQNQSLLDSLQQVQSSAEPTNIEEDKYDCWVDTHSITGISQKKISCEPTNTRVTIDCIELSDSSEGSDCTDLQVEKEIKEELCLDDFCVETDFSEKNVHKGSDERNDNANPINNKSAKNLHNEDEDEAMFETKIEVENHGVRYDDADELGESDDSTSRCPHCSIAFRGKDNLNRHFQLHHGDPSQRDKYSCPHCRIACPTVDNIRNHIETVHGDKGTYKFHCPHCPNTYTIKSTLLQHIKNKHGDPNKYKCSDCPKAYPTKGTLKVHIESQHGDPTQRKKYTCRHCDKIFPNMPAKFKHIKSKHEGLKFICTLCQYSYKQPHSLKKHIKKNHGDALQTKV